MEASAEELAVQVLGQEEEEEVARVKFNDGSPISFAPIQMAVGLLLVAMASSLSLGFWKPWSCMPPMDSPLLTLLISMDPVKPFSASFASNGRLGRGTNLEGMYIIKCKICRFVILLLTNLGR